MRVFFDTNVLLNSALGEPGGEMSEHCFKHCGDGKHEGWIAWHSLSNIHYIVESRTKSKPRAMQVIVDLLKWAKVAETSTTAAKAAVGYQMSDFEDALQIAAAVACSAEVILTNNTKHFKDAPLPVMTPESFLTHINHPLPPHP
jgi:predicted nucleic acid-binding protein